MKIFSFFTSFQILFYKGSHIHTDRYKPLVESLTQNHHKIDIVEGSFIKQWSPLNTFNDSTILIGHSLGGYHALVDYRRFRNTHDIKGIILLNSHFNSRHKAIYPAIDQESIDCPVLTILSGKDERLPMRIALDDIYDKIDKCIPDKFYFINPTFAHFSGIATESNSQTRTIAGQMNHFIEGIAYKNLTRLVENDMSRIFRVSTQDIIPKAIDLSRSFHFFDALLSVCLPKAVWKFYHWVYFLTQKPDFNCNYIFTSDDSIYLKTRGCNASSIDSVIEKLSFHKPVDRLLIRLPSIHPSILFWLHLPLCIREKEGRLQIPIVHLPVNNSTDYFKIPHPYKIFEKQYFS